MNAPHHMLIVVGARPQFIKAAALHRAMKASSTWKATWVHTGQHHDEALSEQFFSELSLPVPEVRLNPRPSSRAARLGDMMEGIEKAIVEHAPDWVLVFGDTDSTLAGAWAAAAEGVPLVHVEAGLRSHKWSMPEEVNRVLTDRMSSVLVCPTDAAVSHLEAEGICNRISGHSLKPTPTSPLVLRTGDVMHDNALHFSGQWQLNPGQGPVLLTMHRPQNVDDIDVLLAWLQAIGVWLVEHGLSALFPMHPRTLKTLEAHWPEWRRTLEDQNIHATPPMGYVDLLKAAHQAPLVLTDSGGVQKEAFSLGTPCVVLRDTTEWIEQVERGQSALVESPSNVASVASAMLSVGRITPDDLYGDGHAARSILQCLEGFPKTT